MKKLVALAALMLALTPFAQAETTAVNHGHHVRPTHHVKHHHHHHRHHHRHHHHRLHRHHVR